MAPQPSEEFYDRSERKYSLRHLERFTLDLAMAGEEEREAREGRGKQIKRRATDQETKKVHSQSSWIIWES